MGLRNLIMAVTYRKVVTSLRFWVFYVTSFMLSLLFPLTLLFVPGMVVGIDAEQVVGRLSAVVGVTFTDTQEAIALLVIISTLVGVISSAIWSAMDPLMDDLWLKTFDDVLMSTRLTSYVVANVIVGALLDYPLLYIPNALFALAVMGFDMEFAIELGWLFLLMMIATISISVFSMFLSPFLLKLREPWIVLNVLVPLLILVSGVYTSVTLLPRFLALAAEATPLPHAVMLIKVYLATKSLAESRIFAVLVAVTLAYWFASSATIKRFERGVRERGIETKI